MYQKSLQIEEAKEEMPNLIQTNRDGSAPSTGTLNAATDNVGIGNAVFASLTEADYCV